jgi:hypothetical protein
MPTEKENCACELNCAAHQLTDASISTRYALFEFRCVTLTEREVVMLEQAAYLHSDVCLSFPATKVWLSEVRVERLDAGSVRVAGQVVS